MLRFSFCVVLALTAYASTVEREKLLREILKDTSASYSIQYRDSSWFIRARAVGKAVRTDIATYVDGSKELFALLVPNARDRAAATRAVVSATRATKAAVTHVRHRYKEECKFGVSQCFDKFANKFTETDKPSPSNCERNSFSGDDNDAPANNCSSIKSRPRNLGLAKQSQSSSKKPKPRHLGIAKESPPGVETEPNDVPQPPKSPHPTRRRLLSLPEDNEQPTLSDEFENFIRTGSSDQRLTREYKVNLDRRAHSNSVLESGKSFESYMAGSVPYTFQESESKADDASCACDLQTAMIVAICAVRAATSKSLFVPDPFGQVRKFVHNCAKADVINGPFSRMEIARICSAFLEHRVENSRHIRYGSIVAISLAVLLSIVLWNKRFCALLKYNVPQKSCTGDWYYCDKCSVDADEDSEEEIEEDESEEEVSSEDIDVSDEGSDKDALLKEVQELQENIIVTANSKRAFRERNVRYSKK